MPTQGEFPPQLQEFIDKVIVPVLLNKVLDELRTLDEPPATPEDRDDTLSPAA